MTNSHAPDEGLIQRLPLPLAQLYRRAHNAKTALERHLTAFYLWETGLKLLGAVCVVEYARLDQHDPELQECLKNLARPALGHWWEFVRRLVPALAQRGVAGFEPLRDLLLGRSRDDLPRVAGLDAALLEALDGKRSAKAAVYPAELFDRLVRYRNKEIGHGAAGQRGSDFYERMGGSLVLGLGELFGRLDVLAGRRLLFVAEVRQVQGQWLVERYELAGESPRRLESLQMPRTASSRVPDGERVHLALPQPTGASGPEALVNLHPLVIYDPESNESAFLNARKGKSGTEYLCYASGRTFTRPDLGGEQRALLARALGMTLVTEEQAAAWSAKSRAEECEVEESPVEGGRRTLGEFELISELGRGGMGVVYRAWQPSLGRQVALKSMSKPGDPKAEARFRREIKALGQVEHPNVVKIFTSGSDGEQWFYVMELVEGATLADVGAALQTRPASVTEIDLPQWRETLSSVCEETRKREKQLSASQPNGTAPPHPAVSAAPAARPVTGGDGYVRQVVGLMRQAAEAAHALHEHGIIHRDIKPGNILVNAAGDRATLMDLGLAQIADDVEGRLTRTRQFVGTLRYASPQQVLAVEKLDARADVYGIGATLWELLALRPLFGATEETPTPRLMEMIQRDEPARLRSVQAGIARDLEAVVHKCLEKKPESRYDSARALAEDLGRWLESEPVQARPVGWVDRQVKWARRHPKETAAWVLALLVLVMLLIGSGFAVLWREANDARKQADMAKRDALKARDDAQGSERMAIDARNSAQKAEQNEKQARGALQVAKDREVKAEQRAKETKRREAEALREQMSEFQYVEAIRRAQHFLEPGGSGDEAWRELQETEARRRGWEWRYLTQQFPVVLLGHTRSVSGVCFSPDGRWLASSSDDKTVRVWDLVSGGEPRVLKGHSERVLNVTFSPDSRWLASGSADKTVRIWDLVGGSEPRILTRQSDYLSRISFSPDGRWLAGGTDNNAVSVWDLARGGKPRVLTGHSNYIWSVTFSPNSRYLASGSNDMTVRIWDLVGGGEPRVLTGHSADVTSVSFSPDGRRLASGSWDGTVRVWDLGAKSEPLVLKGHSDAVSSVSFSPDGRHLASGSWDNTVRIWILAGEGESRVLTGHSAPVEGVSFSPDGRRLASASEDATVRVWDLAVRGEPRMLVGHSEPVSCVSLSPDGRHMASGSFDKTVRVWNLAGGVEPRILTGHSNAISSVNFSPDGRLLASGSWDETVRIWDLASGGKPRVLKGHTGDVRSVSFSPDGRRLVSGAEDDTVRVWDLAGGAETQVLRGHSGHVWSVSFSPDGCKVASGSEDKTIRVWDLVNSTEPRVLRGHSARVWSVSFSPDGRRLASGSGDNTVRIWDLDAASEEQSSREPLNGDSQYPRSDWHDSNKQFSLLLKGHTDVVRSVSFSTDGRRLISGSGDGTVRIWDVLTGTDPLVLRCSAFDADSVSFGPDGRRLAASAKKSVCVWELDRRALWRLGQVAVDERDEQWFAARFHLDWLIKEETARQSLDAVAALVSPVPFSSAATWIALQTREGRVPLASLLLRHSRTCAELADWDGADADYVRLHRLKPNDPMIARLRTLAGLAKDRQRELLLSVVGSVANLRADRFDPWSSIAAMLSRPVDHHAFDQEWAEMNRQFPESIDAATIDAVVRTRVLVGDGLEKVAWSRLAEQARRTVGKKPESADSRETYGASLHRAGQTKEAVEQLRLSVQKSGGEGTIWQHCFLALAQQKLGNDKEARASLTKAVRKMESTKNPDWEQRLIWQCLREEAEKTLGWRVPAATGWPLD